MDTDAGTETLRPSGQFDRWVQERVRDRRGVTAMPHTLEYRHIYVMPTRFGFWFGVLLALMLVGGLNFNNNMTLLFGFLLGSITLLTTLLAYRNLVGVTLHGVIARPVFSGESAVFRVLLRNGDDRRRFALAIRTDESLDCGDIEPQSTRRLELSQQTWQRGWMDLDPFRIENSFPLGMFRAWSVIIPRARCLVYPAPATHAPASNPVVVELHRQAIGMLTSIAEDQHPLI